MLLYALCDIDLNICVIILTIIHLVWVGVLAAKNKSMQLIIMCLDVVESINEHSEIEIIKIDVVV